MRRSPIAALAAVAYAVILADLLSKLFALSLVGSDALTLTERFRLAVVHNDGAAFGLPLRQLGLEASTIIIFLLILLMLRVCRELAEVDRHAPVMLGLIAGAGAANHMDMLVSPHGVVDFIAFGHIVFNVADIALAAGLVLCARTSWLLVMRIAEERARTPVLATGGIGVGSAGAGGAGEAHRRAPLTAEGVRQLSVYHEPETAMMPRAAKDSGKGDAEAGLLDFSRRFDRAATPALVIACSFILLYSLAMVWLPDAGRSAPSAILLALGVFGTVFLAVYVDLVLAERRSKARAAASLRRAVEAVVPMPVTVDLPPAGPGDPAPDTERLTRLEQLARRREKGDGPRSDA